MGPHPPAAPLPGPALRRGPPRPVAARADAAFADAAALRARAEEAASAAMGALRFTGEGTTGL